MSLKVITKTTTTDQGLFHPASGGCKTHQNRNLQPGGSCVPMCPVSQECGPGLSTFGGPYPRKTRSGENVGPGSHRLEGGQHPTSPQPAVYLGLQLRYSRAGGGTSLRDCGRLPVVQLPRMGDSKIACLLAFCTPPPQLPGNSRIPGGPIRTPRARGGTGRRWVSEPLAPRRINAHPVKYVRGAASPVAPEPKVG